jgi:perosamine synthetase
MKKKLGLNKKAFFPVSMPNVTQKDIISVNKALKAGWISSEGPEVKKFEKNFSKYIGHKYAVAVSSGTAALEIAIKSLNLKKGDEIIIPNFTIISNALAAIKQDLKIKLIDCGKFDWNMDISQIKKNISKKTKAIIATHIYNFPLRIDLLKKICKKKKFLLLKMPPKY